MFKTEKCHNKYISIKSVSTNDKQKVIISRWRFLKHVEFGVKNILFNKFKISTS
ncbi:hypothetical protein SXY01_16810 [Staphylococcus xylosus]|nr:hypothetical protein SXY01_16810 [Staphylococcus xylosus]